MSSPFTQQLRGFFFCSALIIGFGLLSPIKKPTPLPIPTNDETAYIILSPHFDDAVLSLGGLLAKEGSQATAVTFFTGTPSRTLTEDWDRISGFKNSDEAMVARTQENNEALHTLNVKLVNLGFLDHQYREPLTEKNLEDAMLTTISHLVEKVPEKNISIYGPSRFGPEITHPDHLLVHNVTLRLFHTLHNDPRFHFYLYEDYPYTDRYHEKYRESLSSFLEGADHLTLKEKTIPLLESEIERKNSALRAYTSQVTAFTSLHSNILALTDRFTHHRCAPLPPPYSGCEVVREVLH